MPSKIKINCSICQHEFLAYESAIKRGKNKTCSLKCSYIQRGLDKSADLVGQQRGMLKIISRYGHKYKKVLWLALCDCGNYTTVTTGEFKRNDGRFKKSCGCLGSLKGEKSPRWKGTGGLSASYWSRVKLGALTRGLEFDISMDCVVEMFHRQNKKCILSGIDIEMNKTASLDRIDSKLGYVKDNVQWVHKDINKLKSDFNQDYFIELCKKIANQNFNIIRK